MGLIVVLILPLGPFILKLIPNNQGNLFGFFIEKPDSKSKLLPWIINENETLKETFEGWEIHEKYGHIALKPPEEHKREEVILTPSMSILWQPEIKGHYWNDGMYHFFPKKTKQSCEVSEYDLCKNFKMLGAN